MEDQQTSYAAQCEYYTNYIQSKADWEFVGLYSDEGISGCNTFKREGFNKMIADALNGQIDMYNQRLIQWGGYENAENRVIGGFS